MEVQAMPALHAPDAAPVFGDMPAAVVEISLLLPANRAEALVALSRRRRESVGQILRRLIDGVLEAEG
jgi:hypothetical protein